MGCLADFASVPPYPAACTPAYHRVRLQPPNRDISCLGSDPVTQRPAIRKRGVTDSTRAHNAGVDPPTRRCP